jgi:secondary thiamine-phosphate synthase enzyme
MKSVRKLIEVQTQQQVEIVDITRQVMEIVRSSGVSEGMALVYPHHTSSAVYISDSDRCLQGDFESVLALLVPERDDYAHDRTDPKLNATAHLKAILAGHHVVMPVTNGKLDLGTYQTVYYAEFDGRRTKEILVKVIGD